MPETIFAQATPEGVSGVAVIRISGPRSFSLIEALGAKTPAPRQAQLSTLWDPSNKKKIDQVLVLAFLAPHSFTGEDVVEIQCHGSRAVVVALTAALRDLGAVPAEPGAFSRRALENGKMDLLDLEALDALIHANDPARLALAHGQTGRDRARTFADWRSKLTKLQAGCEALIDFPEDDLPQSLLQQNAVILSALVKQAQDLQDRSERAHLLDAGLEIALAGPPNVGKSTLLNAIAGYDRAIVSEIPGTTRDFVEVFLQIGPFQVCFVDTAGLRETDDPVESMGVARTKDRLKAAALVLNLHEADASPLPLEAACPIWNVQSKRFSPDKLSVAAGEELVPGVDDLLDRIEAWLRERFGALFQNLTFNRERQLFHVKQFTRALGSAQMADQLPELQAEHLRQASQAIAYLSGAIHVEDVLDQLFAGFCIGK